MRNIVFALLLANLGFAAWQRWYAEEAPQVPQGAREFGDIVLASEFAATNPQADLPTVRITEAVVVPGIATDEADAADGSIDAEPIVAEPAVEFLVSDSQPESGDMAVDPPDDTSAGAPVANSGEDDAGTSVALAAAPAAGGAIVCMSVGPFRDLSQVSAAAANLREDGIEPRQRAGEGEIWSGYWVYIERIDTVATAREMIDALHEDGLTDAYVITDSDSGILISLGVFSEIIRASRVRERVRQLGYDATIADRVRRATVYWIDVDLPDGALLDFERLQPSGRIIRLEQRPCREVRL